MMTGTLWTWGSVRTRVAAALLVAVPGCTPLKDLASYSEGPAPEQNEALESTARERTDDPMASVPDAAPAAVESTTREEGQPAEVALEPPTKQATAQPMPAEPEPELEPGDAAAPPVTTAVDSAAKPAPSCDALGGFTISSTSSCYLLGDTTPSWQAARDFCQAWGGDLVEVGSDEENAQLIQRIDGNAWLGAIDEDEDGVFLGVGGNPLGYEGWAPGQPNNLEGSEHCVELRDIDDRWGDVPCADGAARQVICERPPSS